MEQNIQAAAHDPPHSNMQHSTVTEHKIGKITYLVMATSSENATGTVERKIEKLILRDCGRMSK